MHRRGTIIARIGAALALVALAEIFADEMAAAVFGVFALAWLAILVALRRAILRDVPARLAAIAAAGFGLALIDDPNPLALLLFLTAVSMAGLLPRRRYDDAIAWFRRLVWHGVTALVAPIRDAARIARVRQARSGRAGGVRGMAAMLVLPVAGGAVFVALFADANPLIGQLFARLELPDAGTVTWRTVFGVAVLLPVWASLRPAAGVTRMPGMSESPVSMAFDPGVATLTLSLVTFNIIFACQNVLDIAFLWSGAALPDGVTMADYAHRGAYALIVTALLAGLFVLLTLRPGSAGAASPVVRRLVTAWIVQNLLLVASSALRTMDYVDAYGMTVMRLAALAWMALVACGLALIAWRLLAGRSAAWLVNANALAAAIVLAVASVVDLGATAAAWNARTALALGRDGPPLDLCYMARLGPSALVSLALLERHAGNPVLRDRLAYLRSEVRRDMVDGQANWRSWTPRAARRLAAIGTDLQRPRAAPNGRSCGGTILPQPMPSLSTPGPSTPSPLTNAPQR